MSWLHKEDTLKQGHPPSRHSPFYVPFARRVIRPKSRNDNENKSNPGFWLRSSATRGKHMKCIHMQILPLNINIQNVIDTIIQYHNWVLAYIMFGHNFGEMLYSPWQGTQGGGVIIMDKHIRSGIKGKCKTSIYM